MVLTIPLGRKHRLLLGKTRGGGFTIWWHERRCEPLSDPDWPTDEGEAGVREPRRPLQPSRGGAVALPPIDTTLE